MTGMTESREEWKAKNGTHAGEIASPDLARSGYLEGTWPDAGVCGEGQGR